MYDQYLHCSKGCYAIARCWDVHFNSMNGMCRYEYVCMRRYFFSGPKASPLHALLSYSIFASCLFLLGLLAFECAYIFRGPCGPRAR